MYEPQNEMYYSEPVVDQRRIATYLAKVMGWMCVGLLTTVVSALLCVTYQPLFYLVYSTNFIFAVVIAQFVLVIALSAAIHRISAGLATVLFMVYAGVTGVTLSVFFLVFELFSLLAVFGLTAGIFLLMAVVGAATKRDLTGIGSLCIFGLFGIIGGALINIFLRSTMLDFAITIIGVVIFIGLIAYDTQKIKGFYISSIEAGNDEESEPVRKLAIYGALCLYLDFINLFLKLLRLLGRRK